MMLDPSVLEMAGQAVALVGPYLAKKVAEGALEEAGSCVFGWLKERLTGAGAQEALEDLVGDPASEINREGLEVAIKKALRQDEGFREGLAKLLQPYGAQIAKVKGNENRVVQVWGKDNKTNVG